MVPLQLHSWEDGAYVDKTEEVAPGLAASFEDTRVRMEREIHHFVDCVLDRCPPLVTPAEMWTDQAIMDALYNGGRSFA
jgi:predicted dehydrogenase